MMEADYPLVEVFWEDAGLESCQLDIEDAKQIKPMPRKNVGYCLTDDKDRVVICFAFINDTSHNKTVCESILVIPKGMVTKIKHLGN